MNIPVLTYSGKVVVRPDTTWSRNNDDYYVPEFVDSLSWTRVVFVHVSRLGKSIAAKFADRYYDEVAFGALLYPDDMEDGSPEGFASACCLDRTSILPSPSQSAEGMVDKELIATAISRVSDVCRVRNGDLIAIEITEREHLCDRSDSIFHFVVDDGIDFRIIF